MKRERVRGIGAQPVTTYGSQEERDDALEGRYRYDRSAYGPQARRWGTLAIVAAFKLDVIRDFLAWWPENPGPAKDQLRAWEELHFGASLEPAAHGVLAFLVGEVQQGARRRRQREVPFWTAAESLTWMSAAERLTQMQGEGVESYLGRIVAEAGGEMQRMQRMETTDQRLAELRRQKEQLEREEAAQRVAP